MEGLVGKAQGSSIPNHGGIVVASAPTTEIQIRVLVYEPGEPGRVADIPDSVEALQKLVGGFFEVLKDTESAFTST